MTWMTCMMHGMVPCSCCTSRSSTGLQVGKSRFVMVAMTWKVYDWTHVFASFVMETTSEWKVWPKPWRSTRRDLQGPSQTFHRAMVSMTNLVWARLGWLPFRTPSVSCHSTRLNIGSTLQRSAKVTCTLHCRTALPLGISVRFIFSFKWPPSYVKMSASWTISLREVASIESMGKNAIKKKWHWWPAWCTAWSLVHAVPQEARLDCRSESPGSSWSPWHGRSTTEHMLLPALSWKPRVNERSGRSLGGQHGVIFKAPAKRFIEPWLQWQIWFGHVWAGFLSEHPQYHVTPQGSTLAQPAHCTVALQFETCEKSGGLLGAQQLPFQVVWQSREANTPLTHISGILSQKPWRPWWSARLRPGPSAVHLEGSTKRGIGWHHVAPMAWLDQHERFNHTIIVPMRIVNSTWDSEIVSGYCYMLMMLMAISMWSTLLCGFDQQHLGILDHRMW